MLTSQPELAVIHFEIRSRGKTVVCYEAVPLLGLRAGHCVMGMREPKTGARILFSQVSLHVAVTTIPTPRHIAPIASILEALQIQRYYPRLDEMRLDELDAFESLSTAQCKRVLTLPFVDGGVGMKEGQVDPTIPAAYYCLPTT